MSTAVETPAGAVVAFPTRPKRDEGLTLRHCIDAYMSQYAGRDNSRLGYLAMWVDALGDQTIASLDADTVGDALDRFAATPVQRYAGQKDGKPVLRTFGARRPATINRSKAMLSAVLTWAQRRRLTPRGWHNPCREIPGLRENNARVRFLSNEERKRLLSLALAPA